MLLDLMDKDAQLKPQMLGKLSAFLTRDDDGHLFGPTVSPRAGAGDG